MHTVPVGMMAEKKMLLEVENKKLGALEWIKENRDTIERQISTEGALLIRGLNVDTAEEFSAILTTLFEEKLAKYTYRSTPRTEVKNNIYTATEYHHSQSIPQHNENSYSHSWPMRIGFLCVTPAEKMGNTPISDSHVAYQEIPSEIRKEFERKKVMYVRNYSKIDLPWQEVFQTNDRAAVEQFCASNNIQVEWTAEGLRTKQVSQATLEHPVAHQKLWFNQAHLFHVSGLEEELREGLIELLGEDHLPRNAYFGDGTTIDEEMLSVIRDVYERTKFSFQWAQSDILLLDNMLYTHGREPFEGPRKVLVGMAREFCL